MDTYRDLVLRTRNSALYLSGDIERPFVYSLINGLAVPVARAEIQAPSPAPSLALRASALVLTAMLVDPRLGNLGTAARQTQPLSDWHHNIALEKDAPLPTFITTSRKQGAASPLEMRLSATEAAPSHVYQPEFINILLNLGASAMHTLTLSKIHERNVGPRIAKAYRNVMNTQNLPQ